MYVMSVIVDYHILIMYRSNTKMKLKDCTYGKLVINHDRDEVGMIVGITNNAPNCDEETRKVIDRAVPLVRWSSGRECGIHPANIEIYKG